MTKPTISVIIPVYNEERTIASIVEVVRTWPQDREIIVVNDEATTDGTIAAIKHFGRSITVITNKKNRGRGDAIAEGIAHAHGDILVLLEGDITNLTHRDLDSLVSPFFKGKAEMVIGVPRYWRAGSFEPFNDVSGTRVVLRKNVRGHLVHIRKKGYGVEVYLNKIHARKRVVNVRLPHVFVFNKFEKQLVPDAARAYIREARELFGEIIRQNARELSPQARRVMRGVYRYLKVALDYFQ